MKDERTSINVRTLIGEESHSTVAIKGLKICIRLDSNQKWINIPKCYTKEELPVDSIEVATGQKVSKWKHLSHIADQVKQPNLHSELPIAVYCLRAEAEDPIELIPSRNDGPYAMKTVYV